MCSHRRNNLASQLWSARARLNKIKQTNFHEINAAIVCVCVCAGEMGVTGVCASFRRVCVHNKTVYVSKAMSGMYIRIVILYHISR